MRYRLLEDFQVEIKYHIHNSEITCIDDVSSIKKNNIGGKKIKNVNKFIIFFYKNFSEILLYLINKKITSRDDITDFIPLQINPFDGLIHLQRVR